MTLPAAETIFLALADVDPRERGAVLDERCGGDPALRREVVALLASLDEPDEEFLDPERVPSLDMARGGRSAAARHTPRHLPRPARPRLRRDGRRLRRAAGSPAADGRDQGASPRLPPS